MDNDVQNIKETTTQSGDTTQKTTEIKNPQNDIKHKNNVVVRIIWFIAGVLLVLLGFRFILSLLGANITNSFANFIYNTSHPFVSPFFSLFNYHEPVYGVSHFETYTLIAMIVYAIIAWGIVKLVQINQD